MSLWYISYILQLNDCHVIYSVSSCWFVGRYFYIPGQPNFQKLAQNTAQNSPVANVNQSCMKV